MVVSSLAFGGLNGTAGPSLQREAGGPMLPVTSSASILQRRQNLAHLLDVKKLPLIPDVITICHDNAHSNDI
jgi:hypothetical protein